MEKPAQSAQPTQSVAGRDDVHVASNRCPYCHDSVEPTESVVCQACLTRHHSACWAEASSCSSCGSQARLEAPRPVLTQATVEAMLHERGYSGEEVSQFFARRVQRSPGVACQWLPCGRVGDWSMGFGLAHHCETHAKLVHKRTRLAGSVLGGFAVLVATGMAVASQEFEDDGLLIGAATVALVGLALWVFAAVLAFLPAHPRDKASDE